MKRLYFIPFFLIVMMAITYPSYAIDLKESWALEGDFIHVSPNGEYISVLGNVKRSMKKDQKQSFQPVVSGTESLSPLTKTIQMVFEGHRGRREQI